MSHRRVNRRRMQIINGVGGTYKWNKLAKRVAREEPVCWLRLPGCTVRSQTADHYYPRSTHPHLEMARWNLRGACNACNRRRGNTPHYKLGELRRRLEAQQQPARALGFFQ